jgi:hypothetical protein
VGRGGGFGWVVVGGAGREGWNIEESADQMLNAKKLTHPRTRLKGPNDARSATGHAKKGATPTQQYTRLRFNAPYKETREIQRLFETLCARDSCVHT